MLLTSRRRGCALFGFCEQLCRVPAVQSVGLQEICQCSRRVIVNFASCASLIVGKEDRIAPTTPPLQRRRTVKRRLMACSKSRLRLTLLYLQQ